MDEFLKELRELLIRYDADIDLRTEGGWHSIQYIDVNVAGETVQFQNTVDPIDITKRLKS